MAAGLMIGQLAGFQKLDEMRPGNTQEIGGALRRQLLVFGDQDNRPAQLHVADDVLEQPENSTRQFKPLPIGPDESR